MTSPGLNNFHCIAPHMILEERAQKTGLRRLYKGLLNARRCVPLRGHLGMERLFGC